MTASYKPNLQDGSFSLANDDTDSLRKRLAVAKADIAELRAAIGVMVPSIIRCYLKVAADKHPDDVRDCERTLDRIAKAMARTAKSDDTPESRIANGPTPEEIHEQNKKIKGDIH